MSLVLAFMVVAFTFSLFPPIYYNVSLYLYNNIYKDEHFLKHKSLLISVAFLTTNSLWNILIYNILNKNFRSAFKKLCFSNK